MHSYLKAIGFSKLKNRTDMEALIKSIIDEPTEHRLHERADGTTMAELSVEYANGIGITVCGEYDENKVFHMEHYFPYFRGSNISTKEEVYISKRVDTDAYTGMCDDYRLGVSLIFYLQNVISYLEYKGDKRVPLSEPVSLSALALEGKVLMPVTVTEQQLRLSKAEDVHKNQLIAEAKKGNQEAIDSLTIDDIDLYAMISRRIQQEDIYSIVDTSFIPYGSESDNYTIIGTILGYQQMKNNLSKEEVYSLQLSCNHMNFELCINKKDLFGIPELGRRFKGVVWLQGTVDFAG